MKKLENLFRRVLSMVLCLSMLMGNMGGALAAEIRTIDLDAAAASISDVGLELSFLGIRKERYEKNLDQYKWLENYHAYYEITANVSGLMSEARIKFDHGFAAAGEPVVSNITNNNVAATWSAGDSSIVLRPTSTDDMPADEITFIVGVPLQDSAVAGLLNGHKVTSKVSSAVGGSSASEEIALNPVVSFTQQGVDNNGTPSETPTLYKWTLNYSCEGIQLTNTYLSATVSAGNILDWNGSPQLSVKSNGIAIKGYEGKNLTDTITFGPLTGYHDNESNRNKTDLEVVFYSRAVSESESPVICNLTLNPESVGAVRNLSATTASPVSISKVGKAVVVDGEKCIQWTVKLNYAHAIMGVKVVDTFEGTELVNDGKHHFTISGVADKTLDAANTGLSDIGVTEINDPEKGFSVMINQDDNKAGTPVVITYYTTVPKTEQNPSFNNTYFLQDTANISNTANLYVTENGTEKLASTVTANASDTIKTLKVTVNTRSTAGDVVDVNANPLNLLVSALDPAGNPVTNAVTLCKTDNSTFQSGLMYDAQNGAQPCLLVPADNSLDTDEERASYVTIDAKQYKAYQLNDILYLNADGNGEFNTGDFFKVAQISENAGEMTIILTNDKTIGLEGLSQAYRGEGDFLINTNTNEFTRSSGEIFDNTAYNGSLNEYKYDPSNYLGIAGNFHIVAFEKVWNGGEGTGSHVNGNILAKEMYSAHNFGTNGLDFEVTYIQKYCGTTATLASSDNHLLVLGSYNEFALTEHNMKIKTADGSSTVTLNQPKNVMVDLDTASNPFIDLNAVESQIKSFSSSLNGEGDNGISVDFRDQNSRTLTLNSADGTGYITFTSSQLNAISNNPLYLKGFKAGHDGSIVINVVCDTNTVYMPQKAQIYMDGSSNPEGTGEVTDFSNGRVIWNFVNAAGKKIYTPYSMTGMIIAPDADVWVRGNVNGTIVADYVHIEGESHRTDFKGTLTPAQGDLSARKYVDGGTPKAEFKFYLQKGTIENGTATFDPQQAPKYDIQGNLKDYKQANTEIKSNDGSSISFPETFGAEGTYVYRLGEVKDDRLNETYTQDETIYYVKVTVTRDAGKLWANYQYYSDANLQNELKGPENFVFRNTSKGGAGKISISGSKAWNDNNNQDGIRPSSITVQLYQSKDKVNYSKVEGQTAIASQENGWMWSFSGLEKGDPNNSIYYKVVEEPVPNGYQVSYSVEGPEKKLMNVDIENNKSDIVITNTHEPETVNAKVVKAWNSETPAEGENRPTEITVYLERYNPADGTWHKVDEKQLTQNDGWEHTWNGLPKNHMGKPITYRVTEEPIADYTTSYSASTELDWDVDFKTLIQNTWIEQKEETTEVTLTKTWNDSGNEDKRPGAIVVVLRRWTADENGNVNLWGVVDTTFNQIVTIQPVDGNWSYTWTGLPKFVKTANGQARYLYYVDEIPFGDNYAVYNRYDGNWWDEKLPFNVKMTNTYVAPTTQKLEATKNLQVGTLTENQFTFELTGDNGAPMPAGTENGVYTVKNGYNGNVNSIQFGDISFVLSDLKNVADTNNDVDIVEKTKTFTYTIREKNEGEEGVVYDDTVYKAQIVLSYKSRGTETEYFTASAPKYYKVKEDGSCEEISSTPTFVNTTGADMVQVTVNKFWQTTAANNAVVELWSKDSSNNLKMVNNPITLSQNNQWSYTWKNLPKNDSNQKPYTYYVKEQALDGYITSYAGDGNNDSNGMFAVQFNNGDSATVDITNTETVRVTVNKSWENNNNNGKNAIIQLYRKVGDGEGKPVYNNPITLPYNYQWNYTWDNLAKYDQNKNLYTYYVVEEPIAGYVAIYDGNIDNNGNLIFNDNQASVDIFNKTVEFMQIGVSKSWQGDSENERPDSITVKLTRKLIDGTDDNNFEETLTLSSENHWRGTFANLLKKNDQNLEYVYYIEEISFTGSEQYGTSYSNRNSDGRVNFNGGNETQVDITNRKKEYMQLTIEKEWKDVAEGTELPEVVVVLKRMINNNTNDIDDYEHSIRLNSTNGWKATVGQLDKYSENNQQYTYFVYEQAVEGYTTEYTTGFDNWGNVKVVKFDQNNNASVVITNTKSKHTTVKLTKIWDDEGDADQRPTELKFTLQRKVNDTIDNSWYPKWFTVTIEGNTVSSSNFGDQRPVTMAADGSWTLEFPYGYSQDDKFDILNSNDQPYTYYFVEQSAMRDGQDVLAEYTVEGEKVTNTEYRITNGRGDRTTSVKVNKVWSGDSNDVDHNNDQIIITLYKTVNGTTRATDKSVTLPKDGSWEYTFTDLPKRDDNGAEIVYTVQETGVPANYVSSTTGNATNGFTITNTYVAPVTAQLEATKTLVGAVLTAGQFDFELRTGVVGSGDQCAPASPMPEGYSPVQDKDNKIIGYRYSVKNGDNATEAEQQNGNIQSIVRFPYITYKLSDMVGENGVIASSKTFVYSIQESEGADSHVIYDGNSFNVCVTVKYDSTSKQLSIDSITYNNENAATFTNTYVAPVTAQLEVTKTLTGKDLTAGEFTFKLEAKNGAPMPAGATDGKLTVQNGAPDAMTGAAAVSFGTITYTLADMKDANGNIEPSKTFTYTIKEKVDTKENGYWYDETEYTATVTVTKAGDKLVPSVSYTPNGTEAAPVFTNKYEEITLKGTKIWVDNADLADQTRPASITITATASVDGTTVTKNDTATATNNWAWEITGLPKYINGVEAEYTITEAPVTGYVTSPITKGENGDYAITNTAETVEVSVEKKWEHKSNENNFNADTEIKVQLYAGEKSVGEAVTLPISEGAAEPNWNYTWTNLPTTYADGTSIAYTVKETDVPDGYVSVHSGDMTNGFVITNIFVDDGEVTLEAQKISVGRALEAGKFTFKLSAAEGVPMPANTTATNEAAADGEAGKVTFQPIKFTKDHIGKTFEYTITEEKGEGDDGYTYDSSVFNAKVEVSQNESTKQLVTTVTYSADGTSYTETVPTFTNTYTTTPVEVSIPVSKVLAGTKTTDTHVPKIAGQYTFTLEAVTEGAPMPGTKQVKNNGTNGAVPSFGPIKFEKAGTYTYKITESGFVVGVVNDTTATKEVTITVTDNGAGQLQVLKDGEAVTETETVTFTNTYTTTSLSGNKAWENDADYNSITRPETIKVTVTNTEYGINRSGEFDVAKDGSVNWRFDELPKFDKDGKEIEYTVTEEQVKGYQEPNVVKNDDGTYTITNTLDTIDKSGTKTWSDSENKYKTRPASITIYAMNGDVRVAETTTNADKNWAWSFIGLPKCDKEGKEIDYTFQEAAVHGYTSTVDGTVITNTLETVDIKVVKSWSDSNNAEGFRPDEIEVTLTGTVDNTEFYKETVTVKGEDWSNTWTGLPKKNSEGKEITYAVAESDVPEWYTPSAPVKTTDENGVTVFTITNSREVEKTKIKAKKEWSDEENVEGFRPTSITVHLHQVTAPATDTTPAVTVAVENQVALELNSNNGWSGEWTNLQKYKDGKEIQYTIVEDTVEHYTPSAPVKTTDENGVTVFTITNSREVEKTKIAVKKIWVDDTDAAGFRPDSITIQLKANDEPVDGKTIELKASNDWKGEFTDLNKYANGQEIEYTVEEVRETTQNGETKLLPWAAKYGTPVVAENENKDGYTITNSYEPEYIDISGSKVWDDDSNRDGVRPVNYGIEITLYTVAENGEKTRVTAEGITNPITVKAKEGETNTWSWSFGKLPKYADGKEINYTVEEEAVVGYTTAPVTKTTTETANTFTITNTHEPEKINIGVEKVWDDNDNQDGKRTESVTVVLTADNNTVKNGEQTLNAANSWSYVWKDLPKYANGKEIEYQVTENSVPEGYEVSVTKALAGEETAAAVVNEAAEGTETVTPDVTFTVTNTHTPETVEINVKKVWNDDSNRDGIRPEGSITYYLWKKVADDTAAEPETGDAAAEGENAEQDLGTKCDEYSVSASEWDNYTITNLPKYENGKLITYTLTEEKVVGYTTVVSGDMEKGFIVTNTHTPEETSITATKKWDDASNQDGKRPDEITFDLYADDKKVEDQSKTVTVDKNAETQTVEWTNLPKYANGKEITYTVKESEATKKAMEELGYTVSEDGLTVTNSHTPDKTSVSVKKVWVDSNNQDGIRPDSVMVWLFADKVKTDKSETLSSANNWNAEWTNLDKYKDGKLIAYTVEEDPITVPEGFINGYTAKVETTAEGVNNYKITNTHTPETVQVKVVKVWNDSNDQDGKRPDELQVTLSNGDKVTLNAANNWSATVKDLPKYANGQKITYSWTEGTMPEGYSLKNTVTSTTDLKDEQNQVIGQIITTTITNSYSTEVTSVTVKKVWDDANNQDGIRPGSIKVQLKADGVAKGDPIELTASEDAGMNWSATVTGLPVYADGVLIKYTWEEVESTLPEGYELTKTDVSGNTTTFTNTHEPEKTSITVTKVWDDENNQDGIRPVSIKVQLYADGVAKGDAVQLPYIGDDGKSTWTYTWTDLDKNASGNDITYTVNEVSVPKDYEKKITGDAMNGFIITNKHEPEKVSIQVEKVWNDNNNQDGFRPESIYVQLYADEEAVGKPVQLPHTDAEGNTALTYTWTDLDKKAAGQVITYTVKEGKLENDQFTAVDTFEHYIAQIGTAVETGNNAYKITITNTHAPDTIRIEGLKKWEDANNQDGIRPERVTINLLADGTEIKEAIANAAGEWKWSFTDLPVYKRVEENGVMVSKKIVYSITEEPVDGYTTTAIDLAVPVNGVASCTITNTHTPETIDISGTKTWDDAENQDGIRPESITIRLYGNDKTKEVRTVTVKASDEWKWKFTGLPKYEAGKSGVEINYSITEDVIEHDTTKTTSGYDPAQITGSAQVGFTVTNKHMPEKTSISVTKAWEDKNDQDGKRPDSIMVQLYADGVANGDPVELKATDNANTSWKYTWTGLDVYKAGTKITYTVDEVTLGEDGKYVSYKPDDYTKEITGTAAAGFVITNTHTPGTTSISGTKVWADNNNQDGIRPANVTITLYKQIGENGEKQVAGTTTVNGTGDNNTTWNWAFNDLPQFEDGQPIIYSVDEETVPEGYTKAVVGNTITNTHQPEKIAIEVTKEWNDNSDQDGIRPNQYGITIKLLADGDQMKAVVVKPDDNGDWSHKFTDLPKFKRVTDAEGKTTTHQIVYTIAEDAVEGYNTDTIPAPAAKADDSKTYTCTVTNIHAPEKIIIEGTKEWEDADNQDGLRPESVTIELYKVTMVEGKEEEKLVESATANKDDWSWKFGELDKFENGEEIKYIVKENAVAGYTTKEIPDPAVSEDGKTYTYTITNTHIPVTTSLSGVKAWSDADNVDNIRPASVTITLLADGEVTDKTYIAKADDGWSWKFEDLAMNKQVLKDGKYITHEIVYSAVELEKDVPAGYTASAAELKDNILTITNTHEPVEIDIKVTKVWDDEKDRDDKRPESITINLLADGTEVRTISLTADANGNWSVLEHTFKDLPKNKLVDGKSVEIVYTVEEEEVDNYTTNITGNVENGFIVTNTHEPEKISKSGTKTWDDQNDQDGKRPESITVTLLADGKVVEMDGNPKIIKPSDKSIDSEWTWEFKDLPKYQSGSVGVEIVYTVKEEGVPQDYTSVVDGMNITNTYAPGKTSISGIKVWQDDNDRDCKRPDSVTINLMKSVDDSDPVETGKTTTATAAGGWTWSFTDLDEYEGGKLITYSVTEDEVESYETDIDNENGYVTITNSYKPETTSVSGKKTWADGENRDNTRPGSITIKLLADGEIAKDMNGDTVAEKTVNPNEDWMWQFDNLPKNKRVQGEDGKFTAKPIVYTVTEEPVDGYTTDYDGMNVTNTNQPDVVSVSVEKVWEDNNNQDGKRPKSITVQLVESYKQGDATVTNNYGNPVTLDAAHGWSYTWTDLPKNQVGGKGNPVTYTVSEVNVPEGYTSSPVRTEDNDGNVSYTITNTDTPDVINISGSKEWNDADNQDGIRPSSITINLLADGTKVADKTVTADANGDWSWTFTGMPKYKAGEVGVEIQYTITEDAIAFDNTKTSTGYTPEPNGFNMKNTHVPETVEVEVIKDWEDMDDQDGKRPDDITVVLLADGKEVETKTISRTDGWNYTFTDLPKNKLVDGKSVEIEYTIKEIEVAGYEVTISEPVVEGKVTTYTITNTHTPETIRIEGLKKWEDANNQDGIRPERVTINLLADGTEIKEAIANAAGEWKWSFTDLPVYKRVEENGVMVSKKIVYSITEEPVDGYTTTAIDLAVPVNGVASCTITNTHTPETIDISGTKTWDDAENQDGIRPESITIRLYGNDKTKEVRTVTVKASDEWKWKFTGLPKYEAGKSGVEINYSITEDVIEHDTTKTTSGYDPAQITGSAQVGFTVTNKHMPEKTSISVTKAWEDKNDQDGKRPDSIMVQLYADGVANGDPVELKATDNANTSWKYTWTGLDVYKAGTKITYTVDEVTLGEDGKYVSYKPDDYTKEITGTAAAGFLVTNKHEPEKITISGTKTWDDANDQDGIRPTSITINLLANGTKLTSKNVTANDGWKWSWTGLDKYKDGKEIEYTITEDAVNGYKTAINGYDVENTHKPELVEVVGSKTWNDADNQDKKRPESITINLLADGEKINSQTIKPDTNGNWPGWKFEDLPKFKAGKEINYTITENAVAGYTTSVTGYNVENSYKPGVTSVTVSKTWDDDNNRDGIRPTSITFNLLADGEKFGSKTITPDADGNWPTCTFDNLPINKVGKVGQKVIYTVTEDVVDGYTATFEDDAATGYVFTNTHKITTTNISGTKTWDDANDQDGIRPESITIRLLANGTAVRSAEVKADEKGEWKYTFTDLPVNENGKAITYTISEDPITLSSEKTKTGYTTTIDGFNVKNTHVPETTEVTVTKDWDDADNQDGKRPESITIRLYANGNEVDSETISADANGKWSFTFTDLPKFAAGKEIVYTISEDAVDKYTTEIDGFSVTNTHVPETTEVTVTKTWTDADDQDGYRPDSIIINLFANGEKVKSETISVDTEGNWSHTFTELPKYAAGKEIAYTITEEAVAEYTTVIDGFNVENTHKPEVVEVSGTKTWTDADDQDGYRPTSITINLLSDGHVVKTAVVTEADGWSWNFTELPKYRDQGVEIVYTITEEAVAEYTTDIAGYDVTNTHEPEVVEVSGTKTWADADNQDGKRPASITINLLADGVIVKTATVTEADGWSWNFTELPKYRDQGIEIVYTITEVAVAEYTTQINGYDVTNTHEPELIEVAGSKTWNDADNQDGKRPTSIVIKLMDGATVVKALTVTEADGWKWSFTDLPKYRPGAVGDEIKYSIVEELDQASAAEYTATVDGYNITNSYTPETVQISGSKTWNDLNNKYLKRPDSVTIRLLADGTEIDHKVVTEADNWSWTFTGLPKYKAGEVGKEVVYTITEDLVTGYITTVEDYNVTNAMNMVEFIKTDEQTGKRLAGAKFALYEGALGTYDESKPVETWVSDLNTKMLTGLKVGQTYTIVETEAPSGYAMMTPFQFTVQLTDIPGTYRAFSVSNCHVYRFRKLDSSNNGLVYGAKLAVLDGNNAVIESWVTSDANGGWHEIADHRLVAGKEYTLVELEAPFGYELADPITFSVDEEKGMLVVNDSYTAKAEVVMYDSPIPEATPTPEPTTTSYSVTKRWEDKDNVLGLRPSSITVHLYRKLRTEAEYPAAAFMTVHMNSNGKNVWNFTFEDLPRRSEDGILYDYTIVEEPVEGYVTSYLNNGKTIVNSIPEEDFPPTPTPTLPYVTPTPSPMPRVPAGVQFIDGEWMYIDEYGIPLGGIPLTGDNTNFILWGMAIGLPLLVAALAAVEIRRRKKLLAAAEQEEEVEDFEE